MSRAIDAHPVVPPRGRASSNLPDHRSTYDAESDPCERVRLDTFTGGHDAEPGTPAAAAIHGARDTAAVQGDAMTMTEQPRVMDRADILARLEDVCGQAKAISRRGKAFQRGEDYEDIHARLDWLVTCMRAAGE